MGVNTIYAASPDISGPVVVASPDSIASGEYPHRPMERTRSTQFH